MDAIMAGAMDRIEREAENARRLTYASGVLSREAYHAKKFPRFEQVFSDGRRRRGRPKQTPEEMLQAMRAWTDALSEGKAR